MGLICDLAKARAAILVLGPVAVVLDAEAADHVGTFLDVVQSHARSEPQLSYPIGSSRESRLQRLGDVRDTGALVLDLDPYLIGVHFRRHFAGIGIDDGMISAVELK